MFLKCVYGEIGLLTERLMCFCKTTWAYSKKNLTTFIY